jgi:hypothetical protein
MMAVHLPYKDVGEWTTAIELKSGQQAWKSIKTPIIVSSNRPTGYSPTWIHMPLGVCQPFFMFKQVSAPQPYHNAWRMFSLNSKSRFRELWSDCIVIPESEYKKKEIQKMVKCGVLCFDVRTTIT